MTEHLGGPESREKIAERQTRYEVPGSRMFKIVDGDTGEAVGSVAAAEGTHRYLDSFLRCNDWQLDLSGAGGG
jgi:hypothetical protein